MNVQDIPVALIDPSPINPNHLSDAKMTSLVEALRRFGWLQNVVVEGPHPDGRYTMRDGHHRLEAAKALGMADVPATVLPADGAAAMLVLNLLRGTSDMTAVGGVLSELILSGWSPAELTVTGMPEIDIVDLVAACRTETPDAGMPGGDGSALDFEDAPEARTGRLVLEVEFDNAPDMRRARRALRKAAGKGNPLSAGLLRALGLLE